jgi:putative transposase
VAQKDSSLSIERKRSLIDGSDPELSVSEPCRLLNLDRSSFYHAKVGESGEDLVLKRHLDRLYTDSRLLGHGRWLWNWPSWASR